MSVSFDSLSGALTVFFFSVLPCFLLFLEIQREVHMFPSPVKRIVRAEVAITLFSSLLD